MIKDLQKKSREDEEEKARKDQKIQALGEEFEDFTWDSFLLKELKVESNSLLQLQYKSSADKYIVGFIAVWRIDVRERLEAVVSLSKFMLI